MCIFILLFISPVLSAIWKACGSGPHNGANVAVKSILECDFDVVRTAAGIQKSRRRNEG